MKNKTLKRVYKMAKPHMKTIIVISIMSLIIAIFEILKPYIIKVAIDDYLSKGIYEKGFIIIRK